MNKNIRRMIKKIERRGGVIRVSGSLPDDVAERFLQEVLSCPDCVAQSQNTAERLREEDIGIHIDSSFGVNRTH